MIEMITRCRPKTSKTMVEELSALFPTIQKNGNL